MTRYSEKLPSRFHPTLVKLFSISSIDTICYFPNAPAKRLPATRRMMTSTSQESHHSALGEANLKYEVYNLLNTLYVSGFPRPTNNTGSLAVSEKTSSKQFTNK